MKRTKQGRLGIGRWDHLCEGCQRPISWALRWCAFCAPEGRNEAWNPSFYALARERERLRRAQ